jgi:transposase-like protein
MIKSGRHYLWGVVDQEDNVLDILVQRRRDKTAAKKLTMPLCTSELAAAHRHRDDTQTLAGGSESSATAARATITWQFTTADARAKLPRLSP